LRRLRWTAALIALPAFCGVNFEREVRPILENHCVRCHGSEISMRNLRLDRRDRARLAITPKKPEESRMYLAAKIGFMPPGPDKLKPEELETLRRWIEQGAHWPKNAELKGKNPFADPVAK
jgi:mono/diheme cytochrome c family protein